MECARGCLQFSSSVKEAFEFLEHKYGLQLIHGQDTFLRYETSPDRSPEAFDRQAGDS